MSAPQKNCGHGIGIPVCSGGSPRGHKLRLDTAFDRPSRNRFIRCDPNRFLMRAETMLPAMIGGKIPLGSEGTTAWAGPQIVMGSGACLRL
jgi:hypothetical protein